MNYNDERELRKQAQRSAQQSAQNQGRSHMIQWSIVGILLIGGVVFGLSKWGGSNSNSPLLRNPKEVNDQDWKKGAIAPTLSLIEYSDFQCPACQAYHPVLKQLLTAFPTELSLVYRHYPLPMHQNSTNASMAAEGAGQQQKFFEMSDLLFDHQDDWGTLPDPWSKFEEYAKQLNLNIDQWKTASKSSEVKNKIKEHRQSGDILNVQGTPTFFIRGVAIENPKGFTEFKKVIEEALKNAPADPTKPPVAETPYHAHANFLVMIEGKPMDFSLDQYQSLEGKELNEDLHLHNKHGEFVHVHKENSTWQTFFKSLGMDLTQTCFKASKDKQYCTTGTKKLSVLLNDTALTDWSALPVNDLDRLLVSYGTSTAKQLNEQFVKVADNACIYSEKCPERGKPDDKEPCVGGLGTKCD